MEKSEETLIRLEISVARLEKLCERISINHDRLTVIETKMKFPVFKDYLHYLATTIALIFGVKTNV